ncbi:MAG TPA: CBS domain-containing protein [Candidatus Udaeobacter sp.]|nr:CBS domain-containing protein [Candidatus Udaeobacter sp.]
MKVSDVMTHRVVTVGPSATVADAARLMLDHRVSGLPVVDGRGGLLGIVTEGDLLRRSESGTERQRPHWLEFILGPGRLAKEYVHSHSRKVADVMTKEVATVGENVSIDRVVDLMERRRIKRLPVIRGGKIVGIISRANLLHALAGMQMPATAADDATIRKRLMAELANQPWAPRASTNIVVRNGVVHLWGVLFDDREREALKVAAENLPGVKAVKDHMVWVEPMSGMVVETDEPARPKARTKKKKPAKR